jgi:soluble cytochrome b562
MSKTKQFLCDHPDTTDYRQALQELLIAIDDLLGGTSDHAPYSKRMKTIRSAIQKARRLA